MVYVINNVQKVIKVSLGGKDMNDASNVYMTEGDAYTALQLICAHETKLGHSGTGRVFCADCRKKFN